MDDKDDGKSRPRTEPKPLYPTASRGPLGIQNSDYLKRSQPKGKNKRIRFGVMITIAVLIVLMVFWSLGGSLLLNYRDL